MAVYAVMALGITPVIITGGIDISVGSICCISGLATVAMLQQYPPDAPAIKMIPLGLAVGCGTGLACGMLNAILRQVLDVHPFIVTLGTLSIIRGVATVSVPLKTLPDQDRQVPDSFALNFMQWFPKGHSPELQPMPLFIALIWLAIIWFFLSWTVAGREIYAVGSNEEAARFSGVRVQWIKFLVYSICGFAAGLAGAMMAGYYASATSDMAEGYELSVIAAAVVGGASLYGGRGTALGAVLGALVIQLIQNGIFVLQSTPLLHNVDTQECSKIIIGVAILVAVGIDRLVGVLRARRVGGAGVV
jgi:ribose/xylose/arabinose/galactoside ABC-type transport system permease subunit